jgi:hypothetical protein
VTVALTVLSKGGKAEECSTYPSNSGTYDVNKAQRIEVRQPKTRRREKLYLRFHSLQLKFSSSFSCESKQEPRVTPVLRFYHQHTCRYVYSIVQQLLTYKSIIYAYYYFRL